MKTFIRNGKEYSVVDPAMYVKGISAPKCTAVKVGRVLYRKAIPGNNLLVFTANGNIECVEEEREWYIVLTRCDESGNPVFNKNGQPNRWQISKDTFEKRYTVLSEDVAAPHKNVDVFVQIQENIAFEKPWGPNGTMIFQTVDAGGYLNITSLDNIYGIAQKEFEETYQEI